MARIFKSLYNFLRNFSFIVVLAFILFCLVIWFFPAQMQPVVQDAVTDISYLEVVPVGEPEEEMEFGIMSVTDDTQDSKPVGEKKEKKSAKPGKDKIPLKPIREYSKIEYQNKIMFTTKEGVELLRPSQIVSVHSERPTNILYKTDKEPPIIINQRKHSLKEIYALCNDSISFYKLKEHIINLNYVERVKNTKSVHKAILENGIEIFLPERKVRDFIRKLDDLYSL